MVLFCNNILQDRTAQDEPWKKLMNGDDRCFLSHRTSRILRIGIPFIPTAIIFYT